MMEMLEMPFMQRAFIAGLAVSALCSILSPFVVLKRLSFLGVGISHSALCGVAIAFAIGSNVIATTLIFSVLVAAGIGMAARRGKIAEDTAIGILFSATMAAGVIIMGFGAGSRGDIFAYLFGSILAVTDNDLATIIALALLTGGLTAAFGKELLAFIFDEDSARVMGLPVDFLYYLLLTLLATVIVITMKIVGLILVSAMLVIPGAAAGQVTRDFKYILPVSIIVGTGSTAGGLALSYSLNLPSGGTIVLTAAGFFAILMIAGKSAAKSMERESA